MDNFLPSLGRIISPSPGDSIQDHRVEKASDIEDDIKQINAHALEDTSTLDNEGGAAVELVTPLGRNLGWFSAFFINVILS